MRGHPRKVSDPLKKPVSLYDRAAVLRILRVTSRQLHGWEKARLIDAAERYSFHDLVKIQKLRDLSAGRVSSAVIRESLQHMQKVAGLENPLIEAGMFSNGRSIAFRHSGAAVEPIAGQFLIDFEDPKLKLLSAKVRPMREPASAGELFARGVQLEEAPATQDEAIAIYQKVVEMDPAHAAAYINLGTLYYNRQDFTRAEEFYRRATAADPNYALAFFDLGNVLDETGRLLDAVEAYRRAIKLAPTYADAHYNLALSYERLKQPRKALAHWQAYAKLDNVGPWSLHARQQIQKIMKLETLQVVSRGRAR